MSDDGLLASESVGNLVLPLLAYLLGEILGEMRVHGERVGVGGLGDATTRNKVTNIIDVQMMRRLEDLKIKSESRSAVGLKEEMKGGGRVD